MAHVSAGTLSGTESEVVRYTRAEVAQVAGCSAATADRRIIPEAVAAGVLVRRGRFWFARRGALSAWLVGEWVPSAPQSMPARTRAG